MLTIPLIKTLSQHSVSPNSGNLEEPFDKHTITYHILAPQTYRHCTYLYIYIIWFYVYSLSDYHVDLQLSHVLSFLGYHYFCIPNLRIANSNYLGSGPQPARHSRRSQWIAAKLAVVAVGGVGFRLDRIPRKWLILGLGFESGFLPEFESQSTGPRPKPTINHSCRFQVSKKPTPKVCQNER